MLDNGANPADVGDLPVFAAVDRDAVRRCRLQRLWGLHGFGEDTDKTVNDVNTAGIRTNLGDEWVCC
jgi:hypothetical protein